MRELLLPPSDVRFAGVQPDELVGRLHISRLMFVTDLSDQDQSEMYHSDGALVPDPNTVRGCNPAEIVQYTRPSDPMRRRSKSDVVLYLNGALGRTNPFPDGSTPKWFGYNRSGPGQLTTTPTDPTVNDLREGLHVDSGDEYSHRLGVCLSGERQLLVATHSARLLLGEGVDISSTAVRERLHKQPELLGELACLHILFRADEGYDAFTEALLHDGSTLRASQKNGPTPALGSEIIFAKL